MTSSNKPSLIAEQYIERISLSLSVSLGLFEASSLAKQVHFLRILCVFAIFTCFTLWIQWYARKAGERYRGLFVLFWRMVDKLVSFVQQIITTLSVSVIIQKMRENGSENETMGIQAKFMVYVVAFVFLTTIIALFGWYFYEEQDHDTLPPELVKDLTTKND